MFFHSIAQPLLISFSLWFYLLLQSQGLAQISWNSIFPWASGWSLINTNEGLEWFKMPISRAYKKQQMKTGLELRYTSTPTPRETTNPTMNSHRSKYRPLSVLTAQMSSALILTPVPQFAIPKAGNSNAGIPSCKIQDPPQGLVRWLWVKTLPWSPEVHL